MALNFGNHFNSNSDGGGRPVAETPFFKILNSPRPPSPRAGESLHGEEIVAAKKKKKMRSLLDIDLNAPPQGEYPAVVDSNSRKGKAINRGGTVERFFRQDHERRHRLWEALLDAAAVAVIREFEGNLGREEMEYRAENRVRNPRKWGEGCEFVSWWSSGDRLRDVGGACGYHVEGAAVHRSKRGRVLALPNRYKDSVLTEDDEEIRCRGKSAAAVDAADRKSRRLWSGQE